MYLNYVVINNVTPEKIALCCRIINYGRNTSETVYNFTVDIIISQCAKLE